MKTVMNVLPKQIVLSVYLQGTLKMEYVRHVTILILIVNHVWSKIIVFIVLIQVILSIMGLVELVMFSILGVFSAKLMCL